MQIKTVLNKSKYNFNFLMAVSKTPIELHGLI